MKTCFLFPGQGAQYQGMAKDFYETSSAVRRLFQEASDASGIDMKHLLFEADEETLKRTRNTQVAVVLAGAAAALAAEEHGLRA
ncbi:MAG TPA: acyltransferase domain-containing protein, partial [Rectinemataceae bacterium]